MRLKRQKGRLLAAGAIVSVGCLMGGCTEPVEDIDRTNPNRLSKSLFEGEWYFARTTIDVPYGADGTFVGDRQEWSFGEDFPALLIRWRIEEGHLMACRADEVVIGGNGEGRTEGDEEDLSNADLRDAADNGAKFPCKHPVAAFKISSHFDVTRQYNASTGEQSNVISENTSDRDWYDREFIRVDWTALGVTDLNLSLDGKFDLGFGNKLEAAYYVQAETGDCRIETKDGWDYSTCTEGYLPPVIEEDNFLITNRMTVVPSDGLIACWIADLRGYGIPCNNSEIGVRYAFRKLPNRQEKKARAEEAYEPLYYPDQKFERFGLWRVKKSTYTAGRGETDFRQYLGTRWNIWEKSHKGCDDNGENCTVIPLADRTLKPIEYYLNREFPQDLKPMAFQVAKEWNDAFNGIKPGVDVTTACKVVCADGKAASECSATDEDWRMEGTCAWVLHENDGTKFMGDLRYNFIAFIEDVGGGQPCGVGGPANDPETGELINATSYVYGNGCFDWIENTVTDMVDILCAQKESEGEGDLPKACQGIDENQYLRGLNILEMMQAQGYKQAPATPIRGLTKAGYEFGSEEMSLKLQDVKVRMDELRLHRGSLHEREAIAEKAGLNRLLMTDEMAREVSGGRASTSADLTDEQIKAFNPLNPLRSGLQGNYDRIEKLAARAVEPAEYIFSDAGLWAFAKQNMDLDRSEFRQMIREQAFRATTLHELGHNMGLRHNFIASFDRANFFPEYWDIKKDAEAAFEGAHPGHAVPSFDPPFLRDGEEEPSEFHDRYRTWDTDRKALREIEHGMGIRAYQYTSIMDYSGLLYTDWNGLGSYDKAAMRFAYAGLVDTTDCQGSLETCATAPRTSTLWYSGGELCSTDSDCPAEAEGQKCRRDDRLTNNLGEKICSNWDNDQRVAQNFNPNHMFCSDDRVGDQPFCNRFDEGESSEQIVRNMIDNYERLFVFNNFRRYRRSFSSNGYFRRILSRYFITIGDQMQSLLYKYFYEPGFRSNRGPGGFNDMFRATVVGFDFLGNVLAQPEAGSFRWNPATDMYENLSEGLVENPTNDIINIPLGLGKPLYSSYEDGYFAETQRLAYAGIFYDKIAALYILTARDLGQSNLPNDERFQLGFHDFFPGAFNSLIGSFISGDLVQSALVFDDENQLLKQRTFWDGNFFADDNGFDPREVNEDGRKVEPGASTYLNLYTLIYAMQYIPYYQDLSFLNDTRLFELGGDSGFSVEGLDPQDVNVCLSPLTSRRFVAVQGEKPNKNIAWKAADRCKSLVSNYADLQEAIETGEYPDGLSLGETESELRDARNRLVNHEDRMSNLVYLSDLFGVGSL